MVYQRSLGAPRTAVFHQLGDPPHSDYSLFLLVLGRQWFSGRTCHLFLQVGLLRLWPVWPLFHLVCRSLSVSHL